jgi:glucoamylase
MMNWNVCRNKIVFSLLALFLLQGCKPWPVDENSVAPGAPGEAPVWAYAGKTGIGTSYEAYVDGQYAENETTGTVSKVWFSLAKGILTETMYDLIHEAQIKELQFVVSGKGFVDFEKDATESTIEYLYTDEAGRPLSLAYRVITRDKEGKYEIEKHLFTHPDRQALFVRTYFRAFDETVVPYLYLNPHINNTGSDDKARVSRKTLVASEGNVSLTLLSSRSFKSASAGFVGVSDGLNELKANGHLNQLYASTGDTTGNVAMIARLDEVNNSEVQYDFVIGFGENDDASYTEAAATLKEGYDKVLAKYNGTGTFTGWSDYLATLDQLEKLSAMSTDGGKLLYASALVLKAQEDKSHAGALIASLSNPWGETASAAEPATGYKGVWPRDFYQCAMAFMAMGDEASPRVAFEYLKKVQVNENTPGNKGVGGWFMQKTHVDGEMEWISIQLDQTAMPIMLGWKLWKKGILDDERAIYWYNNMLRDAAVFLVDGGEVDLDWNNTIITPPVTQQERWEEQAGYSPSTMAAVISGLVCAADLADLAGDQAQSARYLKAADAYEQLIEEVLFTKTGVFNQGAANGEYFIRLSRNDNPDDHEPLAANNGKAGLDETMILDAGFLELVRYGVRSATAPSIVESLPELDSQELEENLKVKYYFTFGNDSTLYPGWRRYGNDGYGEDVTNGANYGLMTPGQRGRVWPFFTGERAHYELAKSLKSNESPAIDQLRTTYVKAMEYFANEGLMLPEQVWDGVGVAPEGYQKGEGTNSATPLAWTHAEYVKLLRSLSDEQVWDRYPNVESRYVK